MVYTMRCAAAVLLVILVRRTYRQDAAIWSKLYKDSEIGMENRQRRLATEDVQVDGFTRREPVRWENWLEFD